MTSPYLTAFNNLTLKFIDELIETFPEENDFKVYKTGINFLHRANAKKFCLLFKNYISVYKTKIINRDETFFLNTDYSEVVNSNDSSVENIILKLKNYWNTLSDSNKTNIWDYLNSLIKLSDLIL